MDHNVDQSVRLVLFSLSSIAIAFGMVVWMIAIIRLRLGIPVIKHEVRDEVPWRSIDLILVLAIFLAGQSLVLMVAHEAMDFPGERRLTNVEKEMVDQHPVHILMLEGRPLILLMCGLTASVVAPITEEFLFRVLLQGWLEALRQRWRRFQLVRALLPRGVGPILIVALLFAILHFRRVGNEPSDLSVLTVMIGGGAVANLVTMAFAIVLISFRTGATTVDFGWKKEKFWSDVGLGISAFLAVAVPVFALQAILKVFLPPHISPDPIPLFFFALVLGTLYYRTHRIVPSVVLHMSLNSVSMLIAWLTLP